MSNNELRAALLADLGVSNRDRLLAAPDTRDASLRGSGRLNGFGRAPSQQLKDSGDSTISTWQAFASHNKDNIGDGDDLHGGQLHRLNRQAMANGSSRLMPAAFHRQPLPYFDQLQDRTPSSHYDNRRTRIQHQAHAQPSTNGASHRDPDPNDPLAIARSMRFQGSYSGKGRGGSMRGSPSARGGYGGTDFCGGRRDRGGHSPQDARSSDSRGGRGSSVGRGRVYPTPPSRGGPVGGQYPRNSTGRGRGKVAIRDTTSRYPQPREGPWVPNGHLTSPEVGTKPVNGVRTEHTKAPSMKPPILSSEDFVAAILDLKWAPKKD